MARRRRIANLSAGEMRTGLDALLGELFDLADPARSRNRRERNCVVRDLATVLEQAARYGVAHMVDEGGAPYPAELTIRTDDVALAAGLSPGTLTSLALNVSSTDDLGAACRRYGMSDPFDGDPALEGRVQAMLGSRHLRTHRMVDVRGGTAGWYDDMERVVLRLVSVVPYGEIDFYLARADHLNERRRRDEAARSYAEAERLCALEIAGGRGGAEVCARRGLALAGMGRTEEAVSSYDEAIVADPGHALAHLDRGVALAGMGRAEEAVASYDEAIRLDPSLARAHHSRANALAALGRTDESLGAYDAAIGLGGTVAGVHTDKGVLYASLGLTDAAIGAYDAAIGADPYAAWARFKKGQLLHGAGRDREAAECYDAAIEIDPGLAEAYAGRGRVAMAAGLLDEALACCNVAIKIDPGLAEAYAGRGDILAEMGRTRDALDSYRRALRIDPAHDGALAGLSRARGGQGVQSSSRH